MKKFIAMAMLGMLLAFASLACAQTFGPAMMGGGFTGYQGTVPANATTQAAWPMFGFGAQTSSQTTAGSQINTAQQNLSAFMPMLQLFGYFGTN